MWTDRIGENNNVVLIPFIGLIIQSTIQQIFIGFLQYARHSARWFGKQDKSYSLHTRSFLSCMGIAVLHK